MPRAVRPRRRRVTTTGSGPAGRPGLALSTPAPTPGLPELERTGSAELCDVGPTTPRPRPFSTPPGARAPRPALHAHAPPESPAPCVTFPEPGPAGPPGAYPSTLCAQETPAALSPRESQRPSPVLRPPPGTPTLPSRGPPAPHLHSAPALSRKEEGARKPWLGLWAPSEARPMRRP